MRPNLTHVILLFLLAVFAVAGPALAQCPMCKAALDGDGSTTGDLGRGFSWGTLILVPAPFLLLGIVGGVLYHSQRKGRSRGTPGDR